MSTPTPELTAEETYRRQAVIAFVHYFAVDEAEAETRVAAIEAAAASRATEGLRTLIGELANEYHQTGLIRDHHDRTAAGWQVRGIETCSDLLCLEARAALSALPEKRGQE